MTTRLSIPCPKRTHGTILLALASLLLVFTDRADARDRNLGSLQAGGCTYTLNDVLEPSDPRDYFLIYHGVQAQLNADFRGGPFNWVGLYSQSEQRWLQAIFPPVGTTQTRFLIQQPNLAPGYYWAAAEKSALVGNVAYSFQFCAGLPPGCRDSNSPSSPRYLGTLPPLGSLPTASDCINRNSDVVDAFTFTVPPVSQPLNVLISLGPRTGNADMSLWSPANTVLATSTRPGTQIDVIQIPLYQGTYTIWVVLGAGPDGDINYNLSVQSICPDTGAPSPDVTFLRVPTRICNLSGCTPSYTPYSECIGGADAADWFLVSEAGRPFQQQMWFHAVLQAGGNATLAIWQGNQVFPANVRTVGTTVTLDATILPLTSYKVGVINLNGAPNRNYTLDMTINQ